MSTHNRNKRTILEVDTDQVLSVSGATLHAHWPDCCPERLAHHVDTHDSCLGTAWGDNFVLSRACLAGSKAALASFERHIIAQAEAHVLGSTKYSSMVEEAVQKVRVRLLVDRKLEQYLGHGPLLAFVRVAISRSIIDLHRTQRHHTHTSLEEWAPILDVTKDPELNILRKRYGKSLNTALRNAWAKLESDDRLILGMQLHEECGVQQIAQLYGIHRTSAARRLVAARSRLSGLCRSALSEALGASVQTIDSIIRAFASSSAWVFIERESSLLSAAHGPKRSSLRHPKVSEKYSHS